MEFAVNRADVLEEMTLLQGAVAPKATVPILNNVLIAAEDGVIALAATDLEVGLRTKCAAVIGKLGAVTIPAKRLFEIIRALPDKEIKFKTGESNWVTISCGSSRFRVAGLPREDFPHVPDPPPAAAVIRGPALGQLIQQTVFAISNEDSRYTLNGALMVFEGSAVTMVATDGHRLAHVRIPLALAAPVEEKRSSLVPKKALVEVLKILAASDKDAEARFAASENHFFFGVGEREVASRQLTGQFPNFEAVLPKNNPITFAVNRANIADAIKRAAILADERSRAVKFTLDDNHLHIESGSADLGQADETLDIAYQGTSMTIAFNNEYLLDFLAATEAEEVHLKLKDAESAAEWCSTGLAVDTRYVVMPMRV